MKIRVLSAAVDPKRQARRQKTIFSLLQAQLRRGAEKSLRWVSTLYPTNAYAMEAGMGMINYEDFVYRAMHADENTADPIAHWQGVRTHQQSIIDRIEGHDQVALRGPNVDLSLSIKGRTFNNACGIHNLPDGEIYTGPVEVFCQRLGALYLPGDVPGAHRGRDPAQVRRWQSRAGQCNRK